MNAELQRWNQRAHTNPKLGIRSWEFRLQAVCRFYLSTADYADCADVFQSSDAYEIPLSAQIRAIRGFMKRWGPLIEHF